MRNSVKWLISFFHAFLLLFFAIWWQSSSFTYGDERFLVTWSSIFKRVVLHIDEDPPAKDYLFINLAYDKSLIPREEGTGVEVITDRKLLAGFFSILQKNQSTYQYAVCDVLLKGQSENDSALRQSVAGIKNIVFPAEITDSGKAELSVPVPAASADYEIAREGFLKFRLMQHGEASLPVHMYEQLQHRTIQKTWYGWAEGSRPMINSIIIDYKIRPHELFEEGEYPVMSLSELMLLPEEVIVNEFLKNRIILMGDFEHDVHETVFGPAPGTLILLNVYLNLKDGRHLLNLWWLLFVIAGFTVLSRQVLFPGKQQNEQVGSGWWLSLLRVVTFLSVLSVASFLLFNQHIQVLVLALYFNIIGFILQLKRSDLGWQKLKDWFLELRGIFFNFK